MSFTKTILILIGIWPVKWTGLKLQIYNIYFYFQFFFFIISDLISQVSMIFLSKNQFLETAANLGVTVVYLINIYRVMICRSKSMTLMLDTIEEREKSILKYADYKTKAIYKNHVRLAFNTTLFYVILGTSGVTLYVLSPLVRKYILVKPDEFKNEEYLIYPNWFPFDINRFYLVVYFIEVNGALLGYAYIVYIGAFFLCIMKYCHGQIKILQNFFCNITFYSEGLARRENLPIGTATEIFTKLCIKQHQEIIR